jgi:hypothetical protein
MSDELDLSGVPRELTEAFEHAGEVVLEALSAFAAAYARFDEAPNDASRVQDARDAIRRAREAGERYVRANHAIVVHLKSAGAPEPGCLDLERSTAMLTDPIAAAEAKLDAAVHAHGKLNATGGEA